LLENPTNLESMLAGKWTTNIESGKFPIQELGFSNAIAMFVKT